jgi:crotonobetainyl-CoA:carnitine CoA-transferase CaiB-like acyl-CoA transferase
VQAESGLVAITGSSSEPSRVGISVVDIATGLTAYEAILEALLRRERTGMGDQVEVSLFDSISEWMTVPLLHARYSKAPKRVGLMHPSIAPYGAYTTADGIRIVLSVQNEREWVSLCTVLGEPALADDPRYRDNTTRVQNRGALDALIAREFGMQPSEEICRRLNAADLAYGLINELDAVLAHPVLRMIEVETPSGQLELPAPAARHLASAPTIGPVPGLNQHGPSIREEFSRQCEADV